MIREDFDEPLQDLEQSLYGSLDDAELWDRQIEEDARAGRLDGLAKKALESYRGGKHTELAD